MTDTETARRGVLETLVLPYAGTTGKQRVYLYELAGLHDADALETGTCTGVATIAIARGLRPGRKVYTFDPRRAYGGHKYDDPELLRLCEANLWLCGLEGTGIVQRYVCDVADWKHDGQPKLGLAFIDGDHATEACRSDLETVWPWIVEGGHVAVHDLGMSEIERALDGFLDAHTNARPKSVVDNMVVLKKATRQ